jgi:tetratricopeptide (TPR) repeat protein
VDNDRDPADGTDARAVRIHREIFQLGALIALAVAAFLVTRAVAASNRDQSLRDADEWFRRGQQAVAAGRLDEGIEALRRATVRDRTNTQYVLALAGALARNHDEDAARAVLLRLRDADPEDRTVNLELARLAAQRSDVNEAVRFYHNALYAPWPADEAAARRTTRLELVRFLLDHGQGSRAAAELLALSSDMPEDAGLRATIGELFARAGDDAHALDQFQRALRQSDDDPRALAGAGAAAFRLGQYALAGTYLRRVVDPTADVVATRALLELVLSRDPLAPRLSSATRRQRLVGDVAYVHQRIGACLERGDHAADLVALDAETQGFEAELARLAALEQDTIEMGVDLIERAEQVLAARCGEPPPLDQALALIARRHGTESR